MSEVRSLATVSLTVIGSDGEAETIRPGETLDMDFDRENPNNKQLIAMSAIEVDGETASPLAEDQPDPEPARPRRASGKRSRRS